MPKNRETVGATHYFLPDENAELARNPNRLNRLNASDFTFSQAIARSTGSVLLKTAAVTTVATYNAASSGMANQSSGAQA